MRIAELILVTGLVISASASQAAPLEPAACADLKAEKIKLATDALKAEMAHGAEWAKSNLAAERLSEIRALIELEEQIAFRCPNPKPPAQPKAAAAANPSGETADPASAGSTGNNAAGAGEGPATAKKKKKQAAKATDENAVAGAGEVGDAGDAKPVRKPAKQKPAGEAAGQDAAQPSSGQGLSP